MPANNQYTTRDIFRPSTEPARTIYDALMAESDKRKSRTADEWIAEERQAVFQAACYAADQMGLRRPTLADVERAEQSAMGHVDYAAKWAYGVQDAMVRKEDGDGE